MINVCICFYEDAVRYCLCFAFLLSLIEVLNTFPAKMRLVALRAFF